MGCAACAEHRRYSGIRIIICRRGPCLDSDKSYDIFAKDVRTAAQSRAAGEKGYEEIVVPDYASYMRFYLRGGSGGSLATRYSEATGYNRTGGTAGGGAYIQGTVKVTPGQRIKFYVGASGVGYYDRPAKGGEGYGNGGSSAALPTELGSGVQGKLNSHSNKVTVYSGSGGGSSAIVMVDAKTSQETVLAVAGGGGAGYGGGGSENPVYMYDDAALVGVASGGGGGGNFVSPDVLNPYVNAESGAEWRGEIRDGAITYSFCPSDPNKQPDPPYSPEGPEYWA